MNKRYSKRDLIKDYFPLPNEIFCLNLSYGEIAVYSYLLYRENRKNYQCHPSYKTIGEALKMSRNTVCKYARQLEEKELIAMEPTNVFTKDGKNSTEICAIQYCPYSKQNSMSISDNSKMLTEWLQRIGKKRG